MKDKLTNKSANKLFTNSIVVDLLKNKHQLHYEKALIVVS